MGDMTHGGPILALVFALTVTPITIIIDRHYYTRNGKPRRQKPFTERER